MIYLRYGILNTLLKNPFPVVPVDILIISPFPEGCSASPLLLCSIVQCYEKGFHMSLLVGLIFSKSISSYTSSFFPLLHAPHLHELSPLFPYWIWVSIALAIRPFDHSAINACGATHLKGSPRPMKSPSIPSPQLHNARREFLWLAEFSLGDMPLDSS